MKNENKIEEVYQGYFFHIVFFSFWWNNKNDSLKNYNPKKNAMIKKKIFKRRWYILKFLINKKK